MSKNKDVMEVILEEIKKYYNLWLTASNLSEEAFLSFRTCKRFKVNIQDRLDGLAVQLTYGNDEIPIGLPFFVGFFNSDSEKNQYFENTPLLLVYLAGRLDKENIENPINGSYGPEYFKDRVKKKIPKILERKQEVMETKWNR